MSPGLLGAYLAPWNSSQTISSNNLSDVFSVSPIQSEGYRDEAEGTMIDGPGPGRITQIILRPKVQIRSGDDIEKARELHHAAHKNCFIANSVNFPINCEPRIEFG